MVKASVVALVLAVAMGVVVSHGLGPAVAWMTQGLQGGPRALPAQTVRLVSAACAALVFLWWFSSSRRTVVRRGRTS